MGSGAVFTVSVKVLPRSPRDELAGRRGEEILVRLKAPPVDGKANEALRAFLAAKLGCQRSEIEILRGETGRHKAVRLPVAAKAALDAALAGDEG